MRFAFVLPRAACAALLLAGGVAAQSPPRPLVVSADSVVPVAGEPIPGGRVAIVDGKIKSVGKDVETPAGAEVLNFPGAVVYPGLVDAATSLGARRERDETTTAYEFAVRTVDVVDPFHPGFARALAAGVTTAHVVGGDRNAVAGRSAVVKVGPDGALRVLRADAGLKTSFDAGAYPGDRAPTTPQGALDDLRRLPELKARLAPWRDAAKSVYATVRSDRDVLRLPLLAEVFGRPVVALTDARAARFAVETKSALQGAVLAPFGPGLGAPERAGLRGLFALETPIAFGTGGDAAPATALRLSAASAYAAGVDAARIERALTLDAAKLLGVHDRVGSLAPGKDGDLCVFTRSPADPRARLLLVVQDGRAVYRAPKE